MRSDPIERMRARARDVRTRAAVRRWQYRQRDLAAGVWFRLRRVLADAKAAYAISEEDAARLAAEGCRMHAAGEAVDPAKIILFVDEVRLSTVASSRSIPVRLGPEFLAARAVALVPFDNLRLS
jgi:hypothetical protein